MRGGGGVTVVVVDVVVFFFGFFVCFSFLFSSSLNCKDLQL